MLHNKGRLLLTLPFARWLVEACLPDVVQLVPITAEVILQLDGLLARFHGDPAGRIIVASALACGARLCTCDKNIRRARVFDRGQGVSHDGPAKRTLGGTGVERAQPLEDLSWFPAFYNTVSDRAIVPPC